MKRFKDLLEQFFGSTQLSKSPREQKEKENAAQNFHLDLHFHYGKYNEQHISTIHEHTDESHPLNTALHHQHKTGELIYPLDDEDKPKHPTFSLERRKKNMDKMMEHVPPAPHDFHVYTGLAGSPFAHKMGLPIHDYTPEGHAKALLPAFTSTSILPDVAHDFASKSSDGHDHMLKIHIPEGSRHGTYVATHSQVKSEHEFLLKRGLKIHIHPEPEIHPPVVGKHFNTPLKIWHAKIVGEHENI